MNLTKNTKNHMTMVTVEMRHEENCRFITKLAFPDSK